MGREVRRVPADWTHPADIHETVGVLRFIPLFDGSEYETRVREWDDEAAKWARGEFPEYTSIESRAMDYAEYAGQRPKASDYMPRWTAEEATHLRMYETTSEGTPISPAFKTPEELARWLADHGASAFGSDTASYEGWLRVARGGYACSAVGIPGVGMVSGVEALKSA